MSLEKQVACGWKQSPANIPKRKPARRWRFLAGVTLICVATAHSLFASDPVKSIDRTNENGRWLYVFCGFTALLAGYGGYRWKIRYMKAAQEKLRVQNELLEAGINERTVELAKERDLLRTLFESLPDQIYFKDTQSRFVKASRALAQRFDGKSPEELIGKTDFDFFAEEHARPAFEDEQEIIRTGKPLTGKVEKEVLPDGRVSWVITAKMPWRDASGKIIGTFGISKDITALKDVEAERESERSLLCSMMDNLPDRIYFKDLEGRFVRCSAEVVKALKRPVEEIIGKSDFDFFPAEFARKTFEDEQQIIRTGESKLGFLEKKVFPDGREKWSVGSKMPWRDPSGKIIGIVGIAKDITALKETEAKLEQVHKQLIAASRQAGMAEVATSVLHNVGNVLNSINVSSSLVIDTVSKSRVANLTRVATLIQEHRTDLAAFLTEDPRGKQLPDYIVNLSEHLNGEQKELLQELENSRKHIEHVKEIVKMQQSYAKVSGVTEKVKAADLIEDAVRMNANALARHGVELVRDYSSQSPEITIERHKVLQILVNLIANAKYACDESGRKDKRLTIQVSNGNDRVKIVVQDNGIGIPSENLTRIFNHGFTTRAKGHGFGLHSGALAARELGGSLVAQSDGPGTGARFILELPVEPPKPDKEKSSNSVPAGNAENVAT